MGSSFLFWWVFLLASKRSTLLQKCKINLNAFPQRHTETNTSKKTTKRTAPHNKNPSALLRVYLERKGGPLVLIGVKGPCFEGLTCKNSGKLGTYIPPPPPKKNGGFPTQLPPSRNSPFHDAFTVQRRWPEGVVLVENLG